MPLHEKRYPLRAKVCEACKLVQVDYDVAPEELFGNYVYFSSYSDEWLAHAKAYCDMALRRFSLNETSLVVELASNDGYLLKNFLQMGIPVLGIDPSDTVVAAATKIGVPSLVEFFGEALAVELAAQGRLADLIIGNNVIAHVPLLNDFVAGIAVLLKPQGTVTIEFPHLLDSDRTRRIRHHLSRALFLHLAVRPGTGVRPTWSANLRRREAADARRIAAHLRVASRARTGIEDSAALQAVRREEAAAGLPDLDTYLRFSERVDACRRALLDFLAAAKREGKTVAAYGAAAKGNTLLNFCGLTQEDISMVADRNPHKQAQVPAGLRTYRWFRRRNCCGDGRTMCSSCRGICRRRFAANCRASPPGAANSSRRCPWCASIHDLHRGAAARRVHHRHDSHGG